MAASTKANAIALLKDTNYFQNVHDSLLEALAEKMVPVNTGRGHIFVDEGDLMTIIILLETGILVRTKLSVDKDNLEEMRSSLRLLAAGSKHTELLENSIVIDKLSGRGRVSGLLHSFQEQSHAYATISTETDSKVWLINCDDFREIVSQTPQHCLDVLAAMSRELRVGSKSLRGLVQRMKRKESDTSMRGDGKSVLKVMCYDATSWVSEAFVPAVEAFNEKSPHLDIQMEYTVERLTEQSATYAAGCQAVCLFVNDNASERELQTLSLMGVQMIAMRCAGFDRVDTKAATAFGFTVARVPAYSPYAVAEMAVALLMAVNRKIAKASARVKMANFTLDGALKGVDIHGKKVGVMGTGKIGQILCKIMFGFGAEVLCYDIFENEEIKAKGGVYVSQDEIYSQCDIIFLMMPLLKATYHTIDYEAIKKMKRGVILINTSRGGLVNTKAVLDGIQAGVISGVGMDVYEHEQKYFFQDWSARHIQDPDLVALLGENSVVLTAHQAFFTQEAIDKIVDTTLQNLSDFHDGKTGQSHPNNCIPKTNNSP